jgi:type II secretory pathway pseudopilin PulG
MRRTLKKNGFSAVELLIAIGLMSITATMTIPMFRQYRINADLDTATEHLVQALRSAQILSQSGKSDAMWGVAFQDGTLFAGNSFEERDSSRDVIFPLAPTIETSGIEETSFTRVDGLPTVAGTVYVTSSVTDNYRRIDISENGTITVSGILTFGPGEHPTDGEDEDDGSGQGSDTSSSAGNGVSSSITSSGGSAGAGSSASSTSGTASSGANAVSSIASSGGAGTGDDDQDEDDVIEDQDEVTDGAGDSDDDDEDVDDQACTAGFKVDKKRGKVKTAGTNDIRIKLLGSAITYGAGGPKVDVRVSASLNDGNNWTDLFGGKAVVGGEQQTFENIEGLSNIALRFNGRYSWLFNKMYRSDAEDGHVIILRNGDTAPDYAPFDHQESLTSFLKSVLDNKGKVSIGARDLLILVELGTLDRNADFQDAVILVTFTEKANTCVTQSKVGVKLRFIRSENTGDGDTQKRIYVGPKKIAFAKNQWIPLTDTAGHAIIDGGLVEDVEGLALERGNGWIRVVSHGSHPNGSGKEIVDVKARFRKSYITAIDNDDSNPSENPRDGASNDTTDGDEFIDGHTVKSMVFKTRTTTDDDGVKISWIAGKPNHHASSSRSSSRSSVSSSAQTTGVTVTSDACGVPYVLSPTGVITLKGKADVTVRVVGAESTYGVRGPKIGVRGQISLNGGSTWQSLFSNKALKGNELTILRDTLSGSQLMLSLNGRYSWVFNKTVASGVGDARIRLLRNGQGFHDIDDIQQRGEWKKSLSSIVGADGIVKVGSHDLVLFVDLGTRDRAHYHDAIIVLSFDKARSLGTCTVSSSAASQQAASSASSAANGNEDIDKDGVKNKHDMCAGTVLPEDVPKEYMSFGRYALTTSKGPGTPVYRTGPRKKVGEYTLKDTRGCSCSQLLNAVEDKGYHRFAEEPALFRQLKNLFTLYVEDGRRFGCSESLLKMISDSRTDADREDD